MRRLVVMISEIHVAVTKSKRVSMKIGSILSILKSINSVG